MQRIGGLLLMLAGVSLGAYAFLPQPIDGEEALREMTRISAAPDRAPASMPDSKAQTAAPRAATAAPSAPVETAALPAPSSTWSAIVTSEPGQLGRLTSSKPGDDQARAQLARDLQSELKRVGCYGGEITGNWTPSTRRAMSAFMERVNASLPIDEPDYILLTLVQGHSAQACGAGCPAGQGAGDDGRCVPQAILAARAAKKAKTVQELKIAEDDQRRIEEQRSADAARKADEARIAEVKLKADEARIAEAKRKADEARVAEAKRKADEARVAEAKRKADEARVAEAKRKAEEARVAEAERQAQSARIAQQQRQAAELQQTAEARQAAEQDAQRRANTTPPQSQFVAEAGKERLPWLDDDLTAPFPQRANRPDGMMSIGGPKVANAEMPPEAEAITPAARAMPAVPATPADEAIEVAPKPSAAPVVRQPEPAVRFYVPVPRTGAAGTKAGPTVRRGLPGTKSGVAPWRPKNAAGRPQVTRSPVFKAPSTAKAPKRKSYAAKAAPTPKAFKPPKQKFYFYAQSSSKPRRSLARPGSPAFNMQNAMGGVF